MNTGTAAGPAAAERPLAALPALLAAFGGGPARRTRAPDVLLLGDSVTQRVARQDGDRRPLGAMLADALRPELETCVLAGSGWHVGAYAALLEAAALLPFRPRVVILPVNLRSVAPPWAASPEWSYAEDLAALAAARDLPALTELAATRAEPAAPTPEAQRAYEATAVSYPLSALDTIGAFRRLVKARPTDPTGEARRLRELFVFHYTHPLTAEHPRLGELRGAVAGVRALGAAALVYLLPLNGEAGRRHVGPDFDAIVAGNARVALDALPRAPDVLAVDATRWLGAEVFFHADESTEHLAQAGRAALAQRLAALTRTLAAAGATGVPRPARSRGQ